MRAGRAANHLSAVFLDRDGVINRKAPEGEYVTSWEEFEFLPQALAGLSALAASDARVLVVTNQRGVARGKMTGADLEDIHKRMRDAIVGAGGRLDHVYHCPHEEGCPCRKPATGMFEAAAADFGLRLSETAVIGDQASDIVAAHRIGALGVLVGEAEPELAVDYRAGDLADAVHWLYERGYLVD